MLFAKFSIYIYLITRAFNCVHTGTDKLTIPLDPSPLSNESIYKNEHLRTFTHVTRIMEHKI